MAFPELWGEPFQESNLLIGEFEPLFSDTEFQAEQTVMLRKQIMPDPDPTDTTGRDSDALEA